MALFIFLILGLSSVSAEEVYNGPKDTYAHMGTVITPVKGTKRPFYLYAELRPLAPIPRRGRVGETTMFDAYVVGYSYFLPFFFSHDQWIEVIPVKDGELLTDRYWAYWGRENRWPLGFEVPDTIDRELKMEIIEVLKRIYPKVSPSNFSERSKETPCHPLDHPDFCAEQIALFNRF